MVVIEVVERLEVDSDISGVLDTVYVTALVLCYTIDDIHRVAMGSIDLLTYRDMNCSSDSVARNKMCE